MKIAFLGTGIMGGPMAANLAKAGHEVTVWNRTPQKAAIGNTTRAETPKDATAGAEVVWLCVSDTEAVNRVLFAEDGAFHSVRPGMIVADSSTISPTASRSFAERFQQAGAGFVDCPVTGSKKGAEAGELIFIVGGENSTVERLQPLFSVMGKKVFHIGGNGMGLATKLAMNLNIALIFEGFCEGLVLAEKAGVTPRQMLDIISATMLRSGVVEYKGQFVERRDFSANFPLKLMLKDIHLMLDYAKELRVKLPALETVEEVYSVASEEGFGDLDYAATLSLLERWAGLAAQTAAD